MKSLIRITKKDSFWLSKFFPDKYPGMIKICNKPLLEFLVDFSIMAGATQIRIVMDDPVEEVENFFGDGSRQGIPISYGIARPEDEISAVLQKNSQFCAQSDLLIISGFFFITYHKEEKYKDFFQDNGEWTLSCATGTISFQPQRKEGSTLLPNESILGLVPLNNINDLFQLNLAILEGDEERYVLPGYNNEKHVFIGQNVEIAKNVTVTKPVMIGNNVQLKGNASVGPLAILGNDIIVDAGTKIERSIIFDATYIGEELEIINKMVYGNRIISPQDEESVTFEDAFLFSTIDRRAVSAFPKRVAHFVLVWPIICFQFPLFFFFYLLLKITGRWRSETRGIFKNNQGQVIKAVFFEAPCISLLERIFYALCLDKFPLFLRVLAFRLFLVGNKPLSATPENKKFLADFPEYLPGCISYSEAEDLPKGSMEEEIAERYFAAHRTIGNDLKMLVKFILGRLGGQGPCKNI